MRAGTAILALLLLASLPFAARAQGPADGPPAIAMHPLHPGVIRGRVLDADGDPVSGAEVSALRGPQTSSVLLAISGADGSYAIEHVPPGTYRVHVNHQAYGDWERKDVEVSAGGQVHLDVQLGARETTTTLEGRVVDGLSGLPLRNVRVAVAGVGETRTDAFGHYRLEDVPGGFTHIRLEAEGYPPAVRGVPVVVDWSTFREPHIQPASELELWKQSGRLHPMPQLLKAEKGGTVVALGARWMLGFLGHNVKSDATATLAVAEHPLTHSGDHLRLAPDLAAKASVIVALGPEFELRVQRTGQEGGGSPSSLGGTGFAMVFYGAREAARVGVNEDYIAVWWLDGDVWRLLPVIPFMHSVDRLNKLLFTGLMWKSPGSSFAPLVTPIRLRLAGPLATRQGGPPPPTQSPLPSRAERPATHELSLPLASQYR